MENENKETKISCGCMGCLIQFIALILLCMTFSLFLGSGEFYNKSIQKIEAIIHGDTIQVNK